LRVSRIVIEGLDLRFRQFAIGRRQVKPQGDKEMNHLNSCLVEGIMSGGLTVSGEGADAADEKATLRGKRTGRTTKIYWQRAGKEINYGKEN
jgi:hypothetical protein